MLTLFALFAGILHENRFEGKTKFPAQLKVRPGPSGQMRFIHGGHVQHQVLAMSSFKSRKQQESSMKLGKAIKFKDAERRKTPSAGFKSRKQQESSMKLGKAIKFKDAERRKCSKLVIPHMQKIAGLVGAFKEKCSTQPGRASATSQCGTYSSRFPRSSSAFHVQCSAFSTRSTISKSWRSTR